MIFVNSMSDLFHKEVPKEFIARVFDTMERAQWHTFQVLTKRSSLMRDYLRDRYQKERGPVHMWFGVSVEDGTRRSRIRHLQDTPTGVRFLSIEPLIGPMGKLDLEGIDWVIVGGESGPGARPMRAEWVRDIRDQCEQNGVAFFFKQWGGLRPKSGGRDSMAANGAIFRRRVDPLPKPRSNMVALSDYAGREQSYVKHVFLERYLEQLVHKTASAFPHVVYVDGFAGPWQSAKESFEDTSFGIALGALHRAKASWKARGREVKMSALLVEREGYAYTKLAQIPAKYPDVAVRTYEADFLAVLPTILRDVPADAFAFFLIDPKGWSIPLRSLGAILARPKSEVIFNFMFDFINRAASIKGNFAVTAGLNQLMPNGNWREKLEAAQNAEERKAILIEGFRSNLAHFGKYEYVAETSVLRPVKDRPLYFLFYATRHEKGIEVFRDCQSEALKEQSKTRAATKVKHKTEKTGQGEIFEVAP